nr:VanZ family protein [Propionicimonas sp.]
MSSYIAYFTGPRTLGWSLVMVLAAAVGMWLLRDRWSGRKRLLGFLLLASIGLVVVVTLLREPPQGTCWTCFGEWGLGRIRAGQVGTDVALNIVLFVPPTFFATLLWPAPLRVTGIAALCSLAIEVTQPLIGVGANDAMDLLANTAGALIGAGAATAVRLLRDLLVDRRVSLARVAKLAVGVAVAAAVGVGGPAWVASARQAAATGRLEQLFAGTTLADFERHRDTTWDAELADLARESGRPTVIGYRGETKALERYTWQVYFAVRCVIAEWTPDGFTTVQLSGGACTNPLAAHA